MKRIIALLISLSLLLGLNACISKERKYPKSGVWYCADLQAQFTFEIDENSTDLDYIPIIDENENYVIVNGDRIAAICGNTPGSRRVLLICQEEDNPQYHLGEVIYGFDFVRLTDTEYVLEDEDGTQYTFVKIADTPES
jgi:hypothetical protein